jgi:8-oxo-dGTP pyrophosphatase MutT (NUDIX family)
MIDKKFAGVLIKVGDKVLLCKRVEYISRGGEWSIPGGQIENGETPIDAAVRELYEETNIRPTAPLNLVGVLPTSLSDDSPKTGVIYIFLMEVDKEVSPDIESAHDGFEHTDWGYFKIGSLPTPMGRDLTKFINSFNK